MEQSPEILYFIGLENQTFCFPNRKKNKYNCKRFRTTKSFKNSQVNKTKICNFVTKERLQPPLPLSPDFGSDAFKVATADLKEKHRRQRKEKERKRAELRTVFRKNIERGRGTD